MTRAKIIAICATELFPRALLKLPSPMRVPPHLRVEVFTSPQSPKPRARIRFTLDELRDARATLRETKAPERANEDFPSHQSALAVAMLRRFEMLEQQFHGNAPWD